MTTEDQAQGTATAEREPRPEKVAVVEDVRERLGRASAAILTEYRGLQVSQMEELRRALAGAGGTYKVYKNTLVRRAADEQGLAALAPLLEGPTAIAFVDGDVASVAKVLRDFARTHQALVVKGGLVGSSLLDARGAQALADLPSRDTLLAQFAGLLAAPMQRMAGLLAAVPQKFAYGLQALIDARVAGGEAAPVPAGEPAEPADAAAPTESEPAAAGTAATTAAQSTVSPDTIEGEPATEAAAAEPTAEAVPAEPAAEAAVAGDAAATPTADMETAATAPAAEAAETAETVSDATAGTTQAAEATAGTTEAAGAADATAGTTEAAGAPDAEAPGTGTGSAGTDEG